MRTNSFVNLTIICAFVPIVIVYSRHLENSKSSAHRDVSKSGEPGEYFWYKVASGQTKSRVEKRHIESTESRRTDRRMVSDRREGNVGTFRDEDENGRATNIKVETDSSGSREQNEGFQPNKQDLAEDMENLGSGPDISVMSGSGSYPSSYMVDVGEEEISSESDGEAQIGENEKTGNDAQNGRNPDVPDHSEDKDVHEKSEKTPSVVEELKEEDGSGSASFVETTDLKLKNDAEKTKNTPSDGNARKLVHGVKETRTETPRSQIYRRKDVDDSIEESEYNKLFKSIESNGDLGSEIERDDMDSYDDLNEEKENLLTPEKVKEEAARSKDVINRHNGKEEILPSTDPDGEYAAGDLSHEVPELSEDTLIRLHERSRSAKTKEILSKLDSDIFSGDKKSKKDLQQSLPKTEYHQRFHRHLRFLRRHQENQKNEERLSPRALSHHAEKGIFNGSVSKVTLQEGKQKHHNKHHHGHPRQRSHHHHHHHQYHHHHHHHQYHHHHYNHHHYNHHHYRQPQPENNVTEIGDGENVTKVEKLERNEINSNTSSQIQAIAVYDPIIYDPITVPVPVVVPIAEPGTQYQTSTYLYLEPPSEGFVYNSLQNADSEGAVCLDGSAPGYYLRKGFGRGEKRWIIYLQGGAWCESEEACLKRSQMHLGSSLYYEPTLNPGGILSNNKTVNPDFYDWNVAYLPYCDGSSFSGNRSDPVQVDGMVLYFRGFRILNSTITELLSQRGLKEARQVVFSGTSAGGLAVMLHADFVRSMLPKKVHFRSLADSGFFLDTTSRKEKRRHKFRKMMQDVFKLHDCTDGVPRKCVEKMSGKDLWKCIFPQYFLRFVKAPLYIVNPLYDSWQLGSIWGISCAFNPYSCTKKDVKVIKRFRRATLKAMKPVLESRSNIGLFADSCIDHGQVIFSAQWKTIKVKDMSIASSFAKWIKKSSLRKYVVDRKEYPANPTCIVKNQDKRSEILTEGF